MKTIFISGMTLRVYSSLFPRIFLTLKFKIMNHNFNAIIVFVSILALLFIPRPKNSTSLTIDTVNTYDDASSISNRATERKIHHAVRRIYLSILAYLKFNYYTVFQK